MKIRIEQSDTEEIVIRTKAPNSRALHLRTAVEAALRGESELALYADGTEYFVSKNDILFFESSGGKVYAHTRSKIYTAPHKLFELEGILPPFFIRVSKSAIVNVLHVSSIKRELVGNGELAFKDSEKKVYFGRTYYKLLQYKIDEMRIDV